MHLHEKKSKAELSKFIESYWHFDASSVSELTLFPDGTFNIFFAFKSFTMNGSRKEYKPGVYLIPITTVPITITSLSNILGIRFKAFSLLNITGNTQRLTLLNDLESFSTRSPTLKYVQEQFDREQNIHEVTQILEQIAFELLEKNLKVNVDLREKVNYILNERGQIRVEDMAREFGVSRQALHKNFKRNLLITPKELAAVWQLNHFFTLCNNEDDSLTERALDSGYYDQAHFINSFKLKFGMSPREFMKNNNTVFNFARDNMSKRFNNYYDPEE